MPKTRQQVIKNIAKLIADGDFDDLNDSIRDSMEKEGLENNFTGADLKEFQLQQNKK